jgi:hypothetical protein
LLGWAALTHGHQDAPNHIMTGDTQHLRCRLIDGAAISLRHPGYGLVG